MTSKRWIIFSVFLLMFFGGYVSKTLAESSRYYNKEERFSISFPIDWEKLEGFMGNVVIGRSPLEGPTDRFRENVSVAVDNLSPGVTLEQNFQAGITQLTTLTDYKEYERGQATIDNTEARWLVYSNRKGQVTVKVLVYSLVKGNRGYAISCNAAPEAFNRYRGQFEEIAKSFQFE